MTKEALANIASDRPQKAIVKKDLKMIRSANSQPCVACPIGDDSFCRTLLEAESPEPDTPANWKRHQTIPAGKPIFAVNQMLPDIYVLCTGWAFRFLQLPGGGRQILNFLLPGDLFSASTIFGERASFSAKALTAVQVTRLNRGEVQARLERHCEIASAIAKRYAFEIQTADRAMTALGRCSAEQRIAYLLLHLTRRISGNNVIRDERYPFPLRQRHIADAVGLSSAHVNRVLGTFRDEKIANLSGGVLELLDLPALEQMGSFA